MMLDIFEEERHILFLCQEDRRSLYAEAMKDISVALYHVEEVQDMMNACIAHPPVMIILDQESLMDHSPQSIGWVHRFETSWPVLHADFDADQIPQVACQRPPHHAPLTEAIHGILNEEDTWQTPGISRSYIRLECKLRARYRILGTQDWTQSNAINVSSNGLYLVSYDHPPMGTEVEVELHDLTEETLKLEAVVAWHRLWEDSNELPGIGLLLPAHEMGLWKAIREARGRMLETREEAVNAAD